MKADHADGKEQKCRRKFENESVCNLPTVNGTNGIYIIYVYMCVIYMCEGLYNM